MKKVNLKRKEEINIGDLNDNHYIGLEFISSSKSYILKIDNTLDQETYICANLQNNLLRHAYLSKFESIQKLLEKIIAVKNVYVFDSERELGEWLIEKL